VAAEQEVLEVGPGTTLRVVAHDERRLEFEASYGPGGTPPPAHLHPHQDEHFEVLAGAMRMRLAGRERELASGELLDVPRDTAHQMWNAGAEQAVMRWTTTPAGRTLDWFRELAAAMAGKPAGDPATLLERYSDVFRLAED
jgi:mannose-6-phosphate isomerase-like protein (cupin superfamily)